MPYVMTENGNIVAKDGMPVFDDNGTESIVDRDGLLRGMQTAMSESKARKLKIKELKEVTDKYLEFADIGPETLREALTIKDNLDEKQLIDAGEKDIAVRQAVDGHEKKYASMVKDYDNKVAELTGTLDKTKSNLHNQIINRVVVDSPFLSKNTKMTPDVKEAIFGKAFKVENINGTPIPIAYYGNGEPIHSLEKMGEYAQPEEALEIMWKNYAYKDNYTPGGAPGSGSVGNTGGTAKVVYTGAQWQLKLAETKNKLERMTLFKQLDNGDIQVK